MIKILDSQLNRLGVVKNVISATRSEQLNGENTLDFEAILDTKLNDLIDEETIFELNDDYFDIALFTKLSNEDGGYTVEVESEHVSYRLNKEEYNKEYFTELGTPIYILGKILEGTDFDVGSIEYTTTLTYSAQEPKSRRQLLMEFVALLGGEIIFNKFIVSIVKHRGSTETRPVIKDRNIKIMSKVVNKRELDDQGNCKISYVCTPVYLPDDYYTLGDNVMLMQSSLGINENLRVVSISSNPYDGMDVKLQFANYVNGLESGLYRVATSTVVKDKVYNGCSIGPEYGFEAIRNDKKARAFFRSDGLVLQSGDGSGENWKDRLYYAYDSALDQTVLMYDGVLSANILHAVSDVISPYVYSDNGAIVNAIVSRLRTDLSKPFRFLQNDISDVRFQDIGDTDRASGRYFEIDKCLPTLSPVQFKMPSNSTNIESEVPLWWYEGKVGGSMTTNANYAILAGETEPSPVMVYQYENSVIHSMNVALLDDGEYGLVERFGGGIEEDSGRGRGYIQKTSDYFSFGLTPGKGEYISGLRVSIKRGAEYYNQKSKKWESIGSAGTGGDGDGDFQINSSYSKALSITSVQQLIANVAVNMLVVGNLFISICLPVSITMSGLLEIIIMYDGTIYKVFKITANIGEEIINLSHPLLNVLIGIHTISVYIKTSDASGNCADMAGTVTVFGGGMVKEIPWDGSITVKEMFNIGTSLYGGKVGIGFYDNIVFNKENSVNSVFGEVFGINATLYSDNIGVNFKEKLTLNSVVKSLYKRSDTEFVIVFDNPVKVKDGEDNVRGIMLIRDLVTPITILSAEIANNEIILTVESQSLFGGIIVRYIKEDGNLYGYYSNNIIDSFDYGITI